MAQAATPFRVTPAPDLAPPSLAPAPAKPAAPRSRRRLFIVIILLALIAAAIITWRLTRPAARTTPAVALRTAVVQRRPLIRTLRLNGKVEAINSSLITAPTLTGQPLGVLVVTHLAKNGEHVHKGDVLVEFDRQDQLKNALDREADFRDYEDQIKRKQADESAARAKDDTDLKQADDAVHSAEWELRRNEVISRIDAEKNQEALDQARATLVQLRETYDLKRKSAQADIHALEIERERARNAMLHARQNAQQLQVRSTMDGIVVLITFYKNGSMGEMQEGDEVRSGQAFMQVMSPGLMQVRARVNQADLALLRPGMNATLHLDAFPAIALPARLERTTAIAGSSGFSNWVRAFVAVFSVQGNDPNLMPDLSAAMDVELSRRPDALVVPRDAVMGSNGGEFVWVKSPDGSFTRVSVTTAGLTDVETAISGGLSEGQVVLRNPAASLAALNGPGATAENAPEVAQ